MDTMIFMGHPIITLPGLKGDDYAIAVSQEAWDHMKLFAEANLRFSDTDTTAKERWDLLIEAMGSCIKTGKELA